MVAQLRGRTGQLAALNLIPTVLFALRNNPFIPVLGVSYEIFNLLHRWAARIVVLESVLHSLAWGINNFKAGGFYQMNVSISASISFQWGMVATVTFTFISMISGAPVRHAFYDAFLAGHRVLVALGLVGVYIHIDRAHLPQLPYLQFAFALWGAELFWRLMRILYYNISWKHGITKVTVEALPADACRVTFQLPQHWAHAPGCHVHAYLPTVELLSSHPFSVAWVEGRTRSSLVEVGIQDESGGSHNLPLTNQTHEPTIAHRHNFAKNTIHIISKATCVSQKSEEPEATVSCATIASSLSLIVRARTGMTRKLYNKASATPNGKFTTWGLIEGPYGGHESFASYGTVVLFAGGVGITYCIGYIHHIVAQSQIGTCSTQKVILVWSVPHTEALEWVRIWMDNVLRGDSRGDLLRIHLYVTEQRQCAAAVGNTGPVQMSHGRCSPADVIAKEMQERIGAMCVTVCGPGAFADSVRTAVRAVVTDGSVDFFEEAFTY